MVPLKSQVHYIRSITPQFDNFYFRTRLTLGHENVNIHFFAGGFQCALNKYANIARQNLAKPKPTKPNLIDS